MRARVESGNHGPGRPPSPPYHTRLCRPAAHSVLAANSLGGRSAPGLTPPCQSSRQERRFRETGAARAPRPCRGSPATRTCDPRSGRRAAAGASRRTRAIAESALLRKHHPRTRSLGRGHGSPPAAPPCASEQTHSTVPAALPAYLRGSVPEPSVRSSPLDPLLSFRLNFSCEHVLHAEHEQLFVETVCLASHCGEGDRLPRATWRPTPRLTASGSGGCTRGSRS